MKTLSVCIPTYEMKGYGVEFLTQNLDILTHQTFKDFDVVISDHSINDDIKNLCEHYSPKLTIIYTRNTEKRGNSPANVNNAIRHATGKLIKILFQDDFLYTTTALEEIVKNFDLEKDHWLVTACIHSSDGKTFFRPFYPYYNDLIFLGKNTISSPSVVTIKNDHPLFFDENLIWSMDCDYYKRCHDTFGDPKIVQTIGVVNRVGPHQISQTATNKRLKKQEFEYILKKYNVKFSLLQRFMRAIRKYIYL